MELDKILIVAVRGGASDIILKTGSVPRFRFNGELVSLADGAVITPPVMEGWIQQLVPIHLTAALEKGGDIDFAYQSHRGYRFRCNVFRQRQNLGIVMRVVSTQIRTLEELQLPPVLQQVAKAKRGLFLATGATGSGKTTTLAAMIQKINETRDAHVITIEDPIEFLFEDDRSTINQREIGIDTESFSGALRSALRQNPDVILVGELRDRETTETALMAAETGHLVLSTLHTGDAVEGLTRLLSYFPPHQHTSLRMMLATSLRGIISQRLVRRKNGKGLVAALEVLMVNGFVRESILKGENFDEIRSIIQSSGETYGMQSFDQALIQLYQSGMISADEASGNASSRDDMQLALAGLGR